MNVGIDHDGEFWGGVPAVARTRRVRVGSKQPIGSGAEPDILSDSPVEIAGMVAFVHTSSRQQLTDVLVTSPPNEVIAKLDRLLTKTAPAWEFLLRARTEAASGGVGQTDLVALARAVHRFYPKAAGRAFVRAAIYLNADVAMAVGSERLPALRLDTEFLVRHDMLLAACLIASENLNVDDDSTHAVANALWRHWAGLIHGIGATAGVPDMVDRLIEDAYLKAMADESEADDDGEPEVWTSQR